MDTREISYTAINTSSISRQTASEFSSGEKTIIDWLAEFQTGPAASFDGREATITGFVYHDAQFNTNTFMISRFVVSCCTADGTPVGLIVHYDESDQLPEDQWLELTGTFEAGEFNGTEIPILVATDLQEIDPPRQPYLYP